jgi:cytochrome c oxidase subunit 3/cytochrome o ubiquinol oxidase subunit 3
MSETHVTATPPPGSIGSTPIPPTSPFPAPPPVAEGERLDPHKVGMLTFLLSEVAFFSTLIVAYVCYLGEDRVGPTPAQVLSLPLVIGTTICLLSSSFTVHLAELALRRGSQGIFCVWWAVTIVLGIVFLGGTAYEWYELIFHHGLTIGRNLFGTTYYTLVGFHAAHVTVGVLIMLILLGLALRRQVTAANQVGIEVTSWYWHFVDAVWVVVFTVVYLVGR